MASIRTFIAFDTPISIRERMSLLQSELKTSGADVRWESVDKFHITIKFLGSVEESVLSSVLSTIERAVVSYHPFDATYRSLGAFPNKKHPRVIWIGCENADGTLQQIKDTLDQSLLPFGFEIEDRTFHPHVTLGRVKRGRGMSDLTHMLENRTFEPEQTTIGGILIMKSVLKPTGSEYSILRTVQLTNQ
jgi:2'-5' RNA ligase